MIRTRIMAATDITHLGHPHLPENAWLDGGEAGQT
jgi:hypothetical protein